MAELIDTNFTPKQYKHRDYDEYGEFSYYWAFCSFCAIEDRCAKLVLSIDLEGYTDESIRDFQLYLEYPQLADILEGIVKDYDGEILTRSAAAFGFYFTEKSEMFNFIKDVSTRMTKNGIAPYNGIDRCSAFPSAEYATNMFTYVLNEDCSLPEIEEHMIRCAGMRGRYDEACGFMELPCISAQKFDTQKNTDVHEFLKAWDDFLVAYNKEHEEVYMPSRLRNQLENYEKSMKPDIPVVSEVSEEYSNFQSMWF